jgi:hypothetical protein
MNTFPACVGDFARFGKEIDGLGDHEIKPQNGFEYGF